MLVKVRTQLFALCFLGAYAMAGSAAEVALAGVIGSKAVLVVNGGAPRAIAVGGMAAEGVRLIALSGDVATVEIDGRRQNVRLGEFVIHKSEPREASRSLRLVADSRGHFTTRGQINGVDADFLVDTGATLISMGRSDALRMGIDYTKGQLGQSSTANGVVPVWHVKLDAVEVGGMRVHGVEAAVHEGDLPVVLLGMSFLKRMEWQREGDALVLKKRY